MTPIDWTNVRILVASMTFAIFVAIVAAGFVWPDAPTSTRMIPMAHITTHNTPDGRCHEDDPCWLAP